MGKEDDPTEKLYMMWLISYGVISDKKYEYFDGNTTQCTLKHYLSNLVSL